MREVKNPLQRSLVSNSSHTKLLNFMTKIQNFKNLNSVRHINIFPHYYYSLQLYIIKLQSLSFIFKYYLTLFTLYYVPPTYKISIQNQESQLISSCMLILFLASDRLSYSISCSFSLVILIFEWSKSYEGSFILFIILRDGAQFSFR